MSACSENPGAGCGLPALYRLCRRTCFPIARAILQDETRAEGVVHRVWVKLKVEEMLSLSASQKVAYLTTAAKREAVRRCEDRDRQRPITPSLYRAPTPERPPDEAYARSELRALVRRMIERLPKRCQEAIALRLEGVTNAEAAGCMGITVSTYEKHITHAYELLRAMPEVARLLQEV